MLALSQMAKANYADTINVLGMGAKGDGVTDDAPAINKALDSAVVKGCQVFFPKTNTGYYLGSSLTARVNIYSNGAEVKGKGILIYTPANNITIDGLTFSGQTNSGNIADFGVIASGNNVHLNNSVFNNTCIKYKSNTLDSLTGAMITNDTFNIDFSTIEHLANQNDVITFRGMQHGIISGNKMNIINCHRVIKLADNLKNLSPDSISIYRCSDIRIENNNIIATTNSNKQVIDCYNGTEKLELVNNYIKADGFSAIAEDKTGLRQDFSKDHLIRKNTIIFGSGSGIVVQGTYGSNTSGYESGNQNITIDSNIFSYTGKSNKDKIIQARYYHDVSIKDNSFSAIPSTVVIDLRANQFATVVDNTINAGIINFGTALTNSAGTAYTDRFRNAVISGNSINNFDGPAAITIEQIKADEGGVQIENNAVVKFHPEANSSVIRINNSNLGHLRVVNNSANTGDDTAGKVIIINSTIHQDTEKDNNWLNR